MSTMNPSRSGLGQSGLRKALAPALFLLLLAGPGSAQELRQVQWQDLPAHLGGELLPVETLGVAGCSEDVDTTRPARMVLQYIENVFYKWAEYDFEGPGKSFCILMIQPETALLSEAEAQVLLSASQTWQQPIPESDEAITLDPSHPSLNLPAALPPERSLPSKRGIADPSRPDVAGPRAHLRPAKDRKYDPADDAGGAAKLVIGSDDRARVTATNAFPWNTVAFVGTTFPNGQQFRGTGFLVAPYTLLTNGHIVFNGGRGGFVSALDLSPGQRQFSNGGNVTRPFGTRDAILVRTNGNYAADESAIEFDYGAAHFSRPFNIRTFMPLVFNVAPTIGGPGVVNLAGYPGEVRNRLSFGLWHSFDIVADIVDRILIHLADSSGGNSGGPLWLFNGLTAQRRVVAIHSSGFRDAGGNPIFNAGPRLVTQNMGLIEDWMQFTPSGTPDPLLLRDGRFRVTATWRDFDGNSGVGQPVTLSNETGYFWFFDSDNVELIVKVLDGRPLNDHFWVFFGSLSNVEFTLFVTDTLTGRNKVYSNPLGNFASEGDVEAIFGG